MQTAVTTVAMGLASVVAVSQGCRNGDSALHAMEEAGPRPSAARAASDGAQADTGADAFFLAGLANATFVADTGSAALAHLIGRSDTRDAAGPRFSWPGTAIAAHFVGTGIAVQLADSGSNYFSVVIDGAAPTALATSSGTRNYALASGLPPGEHSIVLTKRTESYVGVVQYLGLTVTGGSLVPFAEPLTRWIEYVGDSITCGYGVLGTSAMCPFTPATEDETATYAALSAAQLHAMRTIIAYSGIGVLRDSAGSTVDQMPVRFGRALADDPSSAWSFRTPTPLGPDVVVVNLGTNDFNASHPDPGPSFQQAYMAFLQQLRRRYARAILVGTLSPMLAGAVRTRAGAAIQAAVTQLAGAGDSRVVYFEFDQQSPSEGYGCDYHPNLTTQALMSARLVPFLRTLTGW
ncbi:MAG: GDSL-type esterase/lipase family protein [Myxococcota bacterium]|nr:GDSL-type esterase/lipase family protein [Myxococcota bacterium]